MQIRELGVNIRVLPSTRALLKAQRAILETSEGGRRLETIDEALRRLLEDKKKEG